MPLLRDPFELPRGRLLALDVGEARTGAAVCDELELLATPLGVLRRHAARLEDFAEVARLAEQQRAGGILVGLPMDSQGQIGPQARRVQKYARHMAQVLPLPVAFWDESYSTSDAAGLMRETGGRTPIDAAAAAVILRDFLEARRRLEIGD